MLGIVDYAIIGLYLLTTLAVGLLFTKKAGASVESYFLGSRQIPWFLLGMSGLATYLDMSGTMLQTSWFYLLGAKGYWVCYRGAIALPLAFQVIFMAKYLRRCDVMTNAELLALRFGKGRQGQLAELLSVISVLFMAIAGIAVFYIGAEKFLGPYVPWLPPRATALAFVGLILLYVTASGFIGVVYTDLLQSVLILVVMVFVLFQVYAVATPEYFAQYAPEGWRAATPAWRMEMPENYEHMSYLGPLLLAWIAMSVLQGFGLPFDAQTSQRLYAAKDERSGALLSLQWIVLTSFRFFLMAGIGVLALSLADRIDEPEQVLPTVIGVYLPAGVKGLFIAGLLAAAMSTFDSMLNAAGPYFVRDLYAKYLAPQASSRHLVLVSYVTTVVLTVLGVGTGMAATTINDIVGWIMMGLFAGVFAPNILKWFWWRLNGMGFAFGMAGGMVAALLNELVLLRAYRAVTGHEVDLVPEYVTFLFVLAVSALATVLGTFLGEPTDPQTQETFYRKVRPFGFWGPVRQQLERSYLLRIDAENRRDKWLLTPACVFQCVLFWIPTALVLKLWGQVVVWTAVEIVLGAVLYRYWYKNLEGRSSEAPGRQSGS